MIAQLQMFEQPTCEASPNATSLPGSAGGRSPSGSRVGRKKEKSGPEAAHASRLATLAKDWEKLTLATSGRISETSSATVALQFALGNKLAARLEGYGSPEYDLISKVLPMPSGPPIWQRQALVRRTSDKDCSGWPTPNVMSGGQTSRGGNRKDEPLMGGIVRSLAGWPTPRTPTGGPESQSRKQEFGRTESGGGDLQSVAQMAGWPTPRAEDSEQTGMHRGRPDTLNSASKLAGWTTPQAHDSHPRGSGQAYQKNGAGNACLARDAQTAGWATPYFRDWKSEAGEARTAEHQKKHPPQLNYQCLAAGWATPRSTDAKCGATYTKDCEGKDLAKDASTISGGTHDGSPPPTQGQGKPSCAGYLLNPRFSLWLQGYPDEWASCGAVAMQSFRKSRKSSSKASSKPKTTAQKPNEKHQTSPTEDRS